MQRRTAIERRAGEDAWQAVALDGDVLTRLAPAEGLLAAAAVARERAQAPYSRFKVGAALETSDGTIVVGCNVESASYGLTLCAERVALVTALCGGHTSFVRLAVVADTERPTPPCGACRQLLWEYCGDIDVYLGNLETLAAHHRLQALLPLPFDRTLLE